MVALLSRLISEVFSSPVNFVPLHMRNQPNELAVALSPLPPSLPPFSLATTEHEKGPLAKLARAQKKITKHRSLFSAAVMLRERWVGLLAWELGMDLLSLSVCLCVCGRATNDVESRASAEDISYRNLCSKNPCV